MGEDMRASIKAICVMDEEYSLGLMERFMTENLQMTREKGTENSNGQKENFIRASGKKDYNMEKEQSLKVIRLRLGCGKMVKELNGWMKHLLNKNE